MGFSLNIPVGLGQIQGKQNRAESAPKLFKPLFTSAVEEAGKPLSACRCEPGEGTGMETNSGRALLVDLQSYSSWLLDLPPEYSSQSISVY